MVFFPAVNKRNPASLHFMSLLPLTVVCQVTVLVCLKPVEGEEIEALGWKVFMG